MNTNLLGSLLYGICSAEIRIRIASAMAAMARLNKIWQCYTISFASKSPPSSTTADKHGPCLLTLKKGSKPSKPSALRKLLRISYLEHKTNDWVQSKISFLVGPQEPLLATVKRRKLAYRTPRQPLQNHPPGHLGALATPWSAEDMLDGQHQGVDIPAHARTPHKGLLQKTPESDLY